LKAVGSDRGSGEEAIEDVDSEKDRLVVKAELTLGHGPHPRHEARTMTLRHLVAPTANRAIGG